MSDRPSVPHLLGIANLSDADVIGLLDAAEAIRDGDWLPALTGRVQCNAFFENSTRTRLSFDLAGKRLGLHVLDLNAAGSSVAKGETLVDTGRTLAAMGAEVIVIRHGASGAAEEVASTAGCAVINAGDGTNEHPTQALIDALALRRRFGSLRGLTVAICGDVRHSRVARSNAILLSRAGARVRIGGPAALLPEGELPGGAERAGTLEEAMEDADAVMMLRVQHERMAARLDLPRHEYHRLYGLTEARLERAAPGAAVLHPGPINRDVEISDALADDPGRSLILEQVALGVPVRMACLAAVLGVRA